MTFGSPLALLWLALALPLIGLFLVRPGAREAVVSSLLIFKELVARRAARSPFARLERVLSLLLMLAALAAIVLALARPRTGVHETRRIVAVLDASASMGARLPDGGTRFEAALARTRALADELGPGDELGLVLAGSVPHLVHGLDEARLEGGRTNLAEALDLAATALGGSGEVWLLSDGADPALARATPPRGVKLVYARQGSPTDASAGVTALSVRALPGSRGSVLVHSTLVSSAPRPQTVRARVQVDGAPFVTLEGLEIGAYARLALPEQRLELPLGGVVSVRVEAPGDVLACDDEAFAIVPPARRTRVQPRGELPFFLRAALESDEDVTLVSAGEPADVSVVTDGSIATEPALLLPPAGGSVTEAARVTRVLGTHPVLAHVHLEEAVFTRVTTPGLDDAWKPLVLAGGRPLVLVREAPRGVALAFVPEASDLVLKRAWPLLVSNAVTWLRGEETRDSLPTVPAGEVARVVLDPASHPSSIVTPRGERVAPTLERAGREVRVSCARTDEPGVYRVLDDSGREIARFAVSLLDERESTVASVAALGLGETIAPRAATPGETHVELAAILALAAVVLLALESILYHRGAIV